MTREEAIQVLQTALTAPFIYGAYANALKMAIEALQVEVDGDLISKHGVSAWLSNMGHDKLADMVMDEKRFSSAKPKTVEVVHCKDCINRWDIIRCPIDDTYTVNDNDYCSFGIKKIKLDIDYDAIRI